MEYNINLQQIADELDFDLEDVEMLIEVFLESANETMAELKQAIDSNDLEQVYQSSHAIKGSSANLTLMDISNIAKEMEHEAKAGNNLDYQGKFQELKQLIDNIQI